MIHKFNGKTPQLKGEKIFLAVGAEIIGDVLLSEDVSIWFNTTLRGDIEPIIIGQGSNVQDGSSIHTDRETPSIVGENVTIGHNCVVHGCTIGDGSLIGMGSIILTGAKIGKNCLVGAGSLVTGKLEAPDGSLIMGSPARVIKQLNQEALDGIRRNTENYIERKNLYLEQKQ